jgi:hypothetical protein
MYPQQTSPLGQSGEPWHARFTVVALASAPSLVPPPPAVPASLLPPEPPVETLPALASAGSVGSVAEPLSPAEGATVPPPPDVPPPTGAGPLAPPCPEHVHAANVPSDLQTCAPSEPVVHAQSWLAPVVQCPAPLLAPPELVPALEPPELEPEPELAPEPELEPELAPLPPPVGACPWAALHPAAPATSRGTSADAVKSERRKVRSQRE